MSELLVKLSKAASYAFKDDATAPGVLVSHLKDGRVYASVVRYGAKFPRGKMVVCNVYSDDFDAALKTLSELFLAKVSVAPTNPLEDLRVSVGK